jgi:hypothetical protein
MGTLQTEYFTADNADFSGPTGAASVMGGPQFASPYRLESVYYQRATTTAIDIVLAAVINGVVYILDNLAATTSKYYVFPNARVPNILAFRENARITFYTNLCAAAGKHYLVINWSQV